MILARAMRWPLLVVVAVTGCGLDVLSSRGDDASERRPAENTSDGGSGSGMLDAEVVDDGGADVESPEVDAGCRTVVVDDALGTVDDARWLRSSNHAGYPLTSLAPGLSKPMVALVPSMGQGKRGGLWLKEPVPAQAFDVTFDYLIACPVGGPCGDGIGVAWMNTKQPADLDDADTGPSLGLPKRPGGAVTVSLLENPEKDDVGKPATLAIHELEAGLPGNIVLSSSSDSFVHQIRTMTLRLRSGLLTVSVGGSSSSFAITMAASDFVGYFGFVAATSSAVEGAYVSSFHGEFHSCTP